MSSLRILNYTSVFFPSVGGIETHIHAFAQYSKHKHSVLTDRLNDTPFFEEIDGINVSRMWPSRVHNSLNTLNDGTEYLLGPIREFNKITALNKLDFDILHLHGSYGFVSPWELWFPPLFSVLNKMFKNFSFWKLDDKPIVLTIHSLFTYDSPGDESFLSKMLMFKKKRSWIYFKKFYPSVAKYLLCVTPRVRDVLTKICESENVIFVPSGVDTTLFKPLSRNIAYQQLPADVLEKIEQHKDKFLVLYFGRFDPLKGTHLLKEFADKLPSNVKLVVAGYGNSSLLSKSENLLYLGKLDNNAMPALINSCDIVFAPVLHKFTTPRVIYETMACGKPLIIWSQWPRYPVVDGKNAFFVSNMNETLDTVLKLQHDSELCKKIGNEAVITARKNSVQKLAQKVDEIYESIVT